VKGILLAGGHGTRLHPLTLSVSKQLLPVHDKPLIYYPLSTLMLSGIREVLVIIKRADHDRFFQLLGNGSQFGIEISYAFQDSPRGIAEAFVIGAEFLGESNVCLILGDNVFHGPGLGVKLLNAYDGEGAHIFALQVKDPEKYGVIEFSDSERILSIEEKPQIPRSRFVVPGLYFYPNSVIDISQGINPSSRGEKEITDINLFYLKSGELKFTKLERSTAWFDAGTIESLNDATNYIRTIQERQGQSVGCPEEVALRMGYISPRDLQKTIGSYPENTYSNYLIDLIRDLT
jgi:glucose-1-phosphate thymidylyltransferase